MRVLETFPLVDVRDEIVFYQKSPYMPDQTAMCEFCAYVPGWPCGGTTSGPNVFGECLCMFSGSYEMPGRRLLQPYDETNTSACDSPNNFVAALQFVTTNPRAHARLEAILRVSMSALDSLLNADNETLTPCSEPTIVTNVHYVRDASPPPPSPPPSPNPPPSPPGPWTLKPRVAFGGIMFAGLFTLLTIFGSCFFVFVEAGGFYASVGVTVTTDGKLQRPSLVAALPNQTLRIANERDKEPAAASADSLARGFRFTLVGERSGLLSY